MCFRSVLFLLTNLLASSLLAQLSPSSLQSARWNILIEGGKGEFSRGPVCHPLPYFSGSPFRFDYDADLFGLSPKQTTTKTVVKVLGNVQGRKIVQVVQNINAGTLVMKRLLVQRGDDEFCAIYQEQYPADLVHVLPAKLVTPDGASILATKDPNGEHTYNEAYWTFDANGPVRLDLTVIGKAFNEILPAGYEVRGYGFDINTLCARSFLWKQGECNACGEVAAKLALRNDQLVVVRKSYTPQGQPNANDACRR